MQHPYDNYTDMFDAYLSGSMTPADRQELEARLATDPALAGELRLHRLAVAAVRHHAAQADARHGQALQGISRDELEQLLEQKRAQHQPVVPLVPPPFRPQPDGKKKKKGVIARLLPWAAAAVVVGVVGMIGLVGLRLMWHHKAGTASAPVAQTTTTKAPGKTAATQEQPGEANASAGTITPNYSWDLNFAETCMKNGNTQAAVKVLKRLYEEDHVKEAGPLLAKAYLQLDEREKAVDVAQDIEKRYPDDKELIKQIEELGISDS